MSDKIYSGVPTLPPFGQEPMRLYICTKSGRNQSLYKNLSDIVYWGVLTLPPFGLEPMRLEISTKSGQVRNPSI